MSPDTRASAWPGEWKRKWTSEADGLPRSLGNGVLRVVQRVVWRAKVTSAGPPD